VKKYLLFFSISLLLFIIDYTKPVQSSEVPHHKIEPVYITEIVDSKNYRFEFVELFNASSQEISLSGWQIEETRTYDLSKNGITTITPLSGTIPARGFALIVRNETIDAFEKYFTNELANNVIYINSQNRLKINKTYQKFVLKKGKTVIENHQGTFLTHTKRISVRSDLSQFNEAGFEMLPVSRKNATPGWLTQEQMLMVGETKPVLRSEVSHHQIEPVYMTEIVDSKNYRFEFIELFNASSQEISLSGWQIEETRTYDLSKTGITTVILLTGTIPAYGFALIVRKGTLEAFEKYFAYELTNNVTYLNSKNRLKINKTYQKFVLKKGKTVIDNDDGTFLTCTKQMAVRTDLSQFNEASFEMLPVSIKNATPGWLTQEQIALITKTHGLTKLTNQVSDTMRVYYASVYGKTGKALKTALHKLITKHKKLRYQEAWEVLKETDQDPNHPDNVILLYKQTSQPKNLKGKGADDWSREHVWPKSHGHFGINKGPGTDLHHLKPSDLSVNRARGDLDFDNGGTIFREAPLCKKDHDSWEPPTAVKGDIARILFYMDVRYEGKNSEIDLKLVDYTNTNGPHLGKLSTLIEWHKLDPVSDFERLRNDKIYEWQGNRNPFIDYPQWVFEIWSSVTSNQ
jgi:endonuclease I